MKKSQSFITKAKKAGFTILELIVVIAIIAMLSVLILFNSGGLNSAILVSNTAYEIGLIVREAQIAGLGVRATSNTGNSNFTYSQGVHFDMDFPTQALLFSDKDGNGKYSGSIEDVQPYSITNGRAGKILALCAVTQSYALQSTCTMSSPDSTSELDILFTRPNPEAFFKKFRSSDSIYVDHFNPVVINIGFEGDTCRSITIQKTGAVQVDSSYCVPIVK